MAICNTRFSCKNYHFSVKGVLGIPLYFGFLVSKGSLDMVNLQVSRIMSYISSNRQGEHLVGNFYHNVGGGHLCIKN